MGSGNEESPPEKKKIRPTIWISILGVHSPTPTAGKLSTLDPLILTYYPHFRVPIGTSEKQLLRGLALDEFTFQTKTTHYQTPLELSSKEFRFNIATSKETSRVFTHIEPDLTECVCYGYGFTKKYQDILVSDDSVFLYPANFDYVQLGLLFLVSKIFLDQCRSIEKGTAPYYARYDREMFHALMEPPKRPRNLPFSTDAR